MSVFKMPSYRMFWSNATRYPTVADCMSRKRFDTLRTYYYVHMNGNVNLKERGQPGYDPCFKFRPVYDKVRGNCLKVENEEVHSIDEQIIPFKGSRLSLQGKQIIPFKGRLTMKQYIKNKPHKWGINDNFWQAISVFMFQGECTVNLNNLFSKPSTPILTWTNPRQSFLGNYDYASHFTYDNSSVSVRFHFLVCYSITFRCIVVDSGNMLFYTSERHTWIDSVLFLVSV